MGGIINYLSGKKIIIVCGHYGAGKTNLSVNLTVGLKESAGIFYTLVDLDTVNPYFRSADSAKDLQKLGISVIIPPFANSNLDIPSIPAEIHSIFADKEKRAVIDVGGDGAGAVVLGMFEDKIKKENYEMIYILNKYRYTDAAPEMEAHIAADIERRSKLKITSVINNSNIGGKTTKEDIQNSMEYAKKTACLLQKPLLAVSSVIAVDFCFDIVYNIYNIRDYTKKLF